MKRNLSLILFVFIVSLLLNGCEYDGPHAEECTGNSCNKTGTKIDSDGDGIYDDVDNCPYVDNPDQNDTDLDGLGDLCDPCPNDATNQCNNNCTDIDGDGYGNNCTLGSDCNDNNASVHPGATEVCNNIDDDCDGLIDEGVKTTYYRDQDSDTYGNPNNTLQACTVPSGYVPNNTDCNDTSASAHPGATEICDGLDNDCDNQIDEGNVCVTDNDNDGYQPPTDCNDNNAAVHPGATEVCNNIDDDCDGLIDEGVKTTYYRDQDSDTYGDASNTTQACSVPSGYVTNGTDCNDADGTKWTNVSVYPDGDNDTIPNSLTPQTQCLGTTTPTGFTRTSSPLDNCFDVANTNQTDTDQDGIGDACDVNPDELSLRCHYNFPRDYYQYNGTTCVITQDGSTAPWQNTQPTTCGTSTPCVFQGTLRDSVFTDPELAGTCEFQANVPSGSHDNPDPSFTSSRGWKSDWALIGWPENGNSLFEDFMVDNSLHCQLYRNDTLLGNVATYYVLHSWGANYLIDVRGVIDQNGDFINMIVSTVIDSDNDGYFNACPSNTSCVPDNCILYENQNQSINPCVGNPNPDYNDSDNDGVYDYKDAYPFDRTRY